MSPRPAHLRPLLGALALLGASGCTTTATTPIKPLVLPQLSESAALHPAGWHDTIGPDGASVQLTGRVLAVTVARPGGPKETFVAPFRAEETREGLLVDDGRTRRVYDRDRVTVTAIHEDVWPRRAGGGVLLGVGVIGLGVAGAFFILGASVDPYNDFGRQVAYVIAGVTTGVSAGFVVPGAILLYQAAQDPRKSAAPGVSVGIAPGRGVQIAF